MRVALQRRWCAAGAAHRHELHHPPARHVQLLRPDEGADAAPAQRVRHLRRRLGRICVAALNERNLDAVVEAITQVTEEGLRMMLYEWYEAQRALLSPFSEFASASSKLYNHPLSPFAHTPHGAPRVGRPRADAPARQGLREARVQHPLGRASTASTSRSRSRWRSRSRSAGCCASSASPTTCRRCSG